MTTVWVLEHEYYDDFGLVHKSAAVVFESREGAVREAERRNEFETEVDAYGNESSWQVSQLIYVREGELYD